MRTLWIGVVFAVAAMGGVKPASFKTPRAFLGGFPVAAVTGDFNGDGKLDVAELNAQTSVPSSVSVFLGNGDGTLQRATTSPLVSGISVISIIAGDFNHDGKQDLAVGGSGNTTYVLLGNGDGSFKPPVRYAGEGYGLAVGDFNGDGRPDLVGAGGYVSVLIGNGDGTFQAPLVDAAITDAASAAVADLNGDGKLDLVVGTDANSPGSVSVLFGNGDGTFQPPVTYSPGGSSVALGDFNEDGKPDIVAAGDGVSILFGSGGGAFAPGVSVTGACRSQFVSVGDFNGDGHLDLACQGINYDVVVLLGNGNGTFQSPASYPTGGYAQSVSVGDLNGDGVPDLIVASPVGQGGTLTVLLGTGGGTFQRTPSYPTGRGPQFPVAADFNGDGHSDLAVVNNTDGNVSILLGNGDGTFASQPPVAVGGGPTLVATADFNGDGRADLAIVNITDSATGAGKIQVLLGNGDGTFGAPRSYAVGNYPTAIGVADLDHDGKLDLAVGSGISTGKISILKGKGDGTFRTLVTYSVGGAASAVAAADFDGDGKLDLAVTDNSRKANAVWIMRGYGDGTFHLPVSYAAGTSPDTIVAGEFQSGRPALAIGTADGVTILRNDGHGNFQFPVKYKMPSTVTSLVIADFNGDGKPDLAASFNGGGVAVLAGQGTGLFSVPRSGFVAGDGPLGAAAADFNGDGKPDLAVADYASSKVSVLINATP